MGLHIARFTCSLAALLFVAGAGVSASACDQCGGGGHSYSYSAGSVSTGCASCGASSTRRCPTCINGPSKKCRTCSQPRAIDCCSGCGSARKASGCGWRSWDIMSFWSCGGGGCGTEQGCGEIYRGDYASDPPACCDPCDGYGNFIGPGHGYRARYNPSQYVGGTPYDYSADYRYSGGETFSEFHAPAYEQSVQRQRASAPSRGINSSVSRPSRMPYHPQARRISNSNYR